MAQPLSPSHGATKSLDGSEASGVTELAKILSQTVIRDAIKRVGSEEAFQFERLVSELTKQQARLEIVLDAKTSPCDAKDKAKVELEVEVEHAKTIPLRLALESSHGEPSKALTLRIALMTNVDPSAANSVNDKCAQHSNRSKLCEIPIDLKLGADPEVLAEQPTQTREARAEKVDGEKRRDIESLLEDFRRERVKLEQLIDRLNLASSIVHREQDDRAINATEKVIKEATVTTADGSRQPHLAAKLAHKAPKLGSSLSQGVQRIKRMDTLRRRKMDKQDQPESPTASSLPSSFSLMSQHQVVSMPELDEEPELGALLGTKSHDKIVEPRSIAPFNLTRPAPPSAPPAPPTPQAMPGKCAISRQESVEIANVAGPSSRSKAGQSAGSSHRNKTNKTLKSAITSLLGDQSGKKAIDFFSNIGSPFGTPVKKANKRLVQRI